MFSATPLRDVRPMAVESRPMRELGEPLCSLRKDSRRKERAETVLTRKLQLLAQECGANGCYKNLGGAHSKRAYLGTYPRATI